MPAIAALSDQLVVSLLNAKQDGLRQARWWDGLTPDQQDEWLDRIDPEKYGPGQHPPMSTGRWNREKRRVRRDRQRWIEEIRSLRRPCRCHNCIRHHHPPFPRYYVASIISYECWLEEQTVDPELEEELSLLRNDRQRVGAAFAGRRKPATDSWNIPSV
jgi:hypothetical protein